MRLRFLVGVLVFLIVINLATIGTFLYIHFTKPTPPRLSRPRWTMPESPRPVRAPHLRRLPHEHREQLVELLRQFHAETTALRTRTVDLETEAIDLMQLDPVPEARVDSLLREISTTRLEISRIAAKKLIQAKTVLPPDEQRFFFDAILEARPALRMLHGPVHGERPHEGRGRRGYRDSL